MDNLCDLLSGAKIDNQHPYFNMAKTDIKILVNHYLNFQNYDNSKLALINNLLINNIDLYQLNIVIQYIITYGESLFKVYLEQMSKEGHAVLDYDNYLICYVEDLSVFLK
jgi:hypothetical protein